MAERLTADELWKAALGELELQFERPNFGTWFRDTFVTTYAEGVVILGVPSNFKREWLMKKYHGQITATLRKLDPAIGEVRYAIASRLEAPPPQEQLAPPPRPSASTPPERPSGAISPHNTFETFIVGKSNQLAYASAKAVSEQPGKLYNPLFVYGGVGLGKTHLLHAIGNALQATATAARRKIVYVSCETFTNDFIAAIRAGKMDAFKRTYRKIDALLVDDIQFIANKEGTQEEFFHTFNTLHQTNRQIVITADKPPNAIPGLEARLSSRLGWGMVADVQLPDTETREAIIRSKRDEKGLLVPDEVLLEIVQLVRSNIRELEGALTRVVAFAQMRGEPLTREIVRQALEGLVVDAKGTLTVDNIITMVSQYFHVESPALRGRRRTKELVYPRQLTMYLLRHELQLSFPRIGLELGGKDHTTVMYGCQKIEKDLARDEKLQNDLAAIKNMFVSPENL